MTNNKKTFVRITNKDIWNKICDMHDDIIKTNGKVRLNRWIATTALAVGLALAGWKLW